MAYKWKDFSFESFAEAANAWLDWWSTERAGCPTMAENLTSWINATTPEEWGKEAITDIEGYHCGKCGSFILKQHQTVVKRLLEDIEKV